MLFRNPTGTGHRLLQRSTQRAQRCIRGQRLTMSTSFTSDIQFDYASFLAFPFGSYHPINSQNTVPKPQTRNLQPATLAPQPATLSPQLPTEINQGPNQPKCSRGTAVCARGETKLNGNSTCRFLCGKRSGLCSFRCLPCGAKTTYSGPQP